DPLNLSTTSEPVIVSPAPWDFGSTDVGTEIGPRQFVVSMGTGLGSDTVLAINSCPDFRVELFDALPYDIYRICDNGLKPGEPVPLVCQSYDIQTLAFNVYFRPSVASLEGCNVVVDLQTAPDKVLSVQGTGTA